MSFEGYPIIKKLIAITSHKILYVVFTYAGMTKRINDYILSIILLIAISPFVILILFLVYLSTKQFPVFFQVRKITLDRKGIKIFKIRTIKSSDKFLKLEKAAGTIFIKQSFKEHVPPFCGWLRRTGLDEILQLINVIKGEMSLVDPRPLIESDLVIMKDTGLELYNRRACLNSLPGITGYWQAFGNRARGTQNLIELDEFYERQKSFYMDMKIILRSILIVITASHSDSIISSFKKEKIIREERV